MILANFIRRFFCPDDLLPFFHPVPNPKGSQWLRIVDRRGDRPEIRKTLRKAKRKRMSQMENGRRDWRLWMNKGGETRRDRVRRIAWILIPTYPAIKLMNLIRPD